MVDQIDTEGPSRLWIIWLLMSWLPLTPTKLNHQCAPHPQIPYSFFWTFLVWRALLTPSLSHKGLLIFQDQSRGHVLLDIPLPQLPSLSVALSPVLPPNAACTSPSPLPRGTGLSLHVLSPSRECKPLEGPDFCLFIIFFFIASGAELCT